MLFLYCSIRLQIMTKGIFVSLITIFLLGGVSCEEEPITRTCADPLGSDYPTLGNNSWSCFQADINGCFRFELDKNPPMIQSVYVTGHTYASIIDIGPVTCLGDVTDTPAVGYVYAVPAVVGHGYVVRMADSTLGRFYIDSWKKNSAGEITEISFTRQYAY